MGVDDSELEYFDEEVDNIPWSYGQVILVVNVVQIEGFSLYLDQVVDMLFLLCQILLALLHHLAH
jgi:hypothetical protein